MLATALSAARLHLQGARRQPAASLAAIAAVTAVVALGVSIWTVADSMASSVTTVARLAGRATFEVEAADGGSVATAEVDAIAAVPGVAAAVPVIRSTIDIAGSRVPIFGVDARVQALGGDLDAATGQRFADAAAHPSRLLAGVYLGTALAERLGLHVADRVRLTPSAPELGVLGIVGDARLSRIDGGAYVLALLPVAEQLAGHPGRADAVLVATAPSADLAAIASRIGSSAGGFVVSSPRFRAGDALAYITEIRRMSVALVAAAVVGGAVLVATSASLLFEGRRTQLALLVRLGASRRAAVFARLAHGVVVGVAGSGAGLMLGWFVADRVIGSLPPLPVSFLAVGYVAHRDPRSALVALAGSLVVAATFALPSNVQALSQKRRERAPGRTPTAAAVAHWGGPAGTVVALARSRRPARWASVGAAAAVAVAVTVGVLTADFKGAAHATTAPWRALPVVVQTTPFGEQPIGSPLPRSLAANIAAMPGVSKVVADRLVYASDGQQDFRIEAVGAGSATPIVALAPAPARAAIDAGTGLIASGYLARRDRLRVGSLFTVPAAGTSNARTLPVVAVVDVPEPAIAVSFDRFGTGANGSSGTRLEIHTRTPAGAAEVLAALRARGLTVGTGAELATASARPLAGVSAALDAIGVIAVALAAIGLVLAGALDSIVRGSERARLARLGASLRMLRRASAAEQLAALVAGSIAGAALAFAGARTAEIAVARVTSLPLSTSAFPGLTQGVAAGAVAVLVTASAVLVSTASPHRKERTHVSPTPTRFPRHRSDGRRMQHAGMQR